MLIKFVLTFLSDALYFKLIYTVVCMGTRAETGGKFTIRISGYPDANICRYPMNSDIITHVLLAIYIHKLS